MPNTKDYAVGDDILVHAMGPMYDGSVTQVGGKRIEVRYVSGTGVTRYVWLNPSTVYEGSFRGHGAAGHFYRGPRAYKIADSGRVGLGLEVTMPEEQ